MAPILRHLRRQRRTLRADLHTLSHHYRRFPAWVPCLLIALLTILASLAAPSGGYPALPVAIWAGFLLTAVHLTLWFPRAAATTLVVAIGSVIGVPFAYVYGYAVNGPALDPAGSVMSLFATLALTGLLAHRTTLGKPWVTTLLVLLAVLFIGPLLLVLAPWLGFGWAWLLAALVLTLRARGTRWARRACHRRTRHRLLLPAPTGRTCHGRTGHAKATDALLTDLPAGARVRRNLTLPDGTHIDHAILTDAAYLIVSHRFPGPVAVTSHGTLHHPSEPIADHVRDAVAVAERLAPHLGLPANRVHPVVVLHHATLPEATLTVAVGDDRLPTVTLVSPGEPLPLLRPHPRPLSQRRRDEVRRRLADLD